MVNIRAHPSLGGPFNLKIMGQKIILSLFDYTGNWPAPYKKAGYEVIQHDIKHGWDILHDTIPWAIRMNREEGLKIHGLMAAVPCTDFASSGARHWPKKDEIRPFRDEKGIKWLSSTEYSVAMAMATLCVIELLQPEWWVVENPVGRLGKLVPELGPLRMTFQPNEFGDPYTKRTCLWGNFNTNLPRNPVLPLYGSMMHKMSSTKKAERSVTPIGFANAFFKANP